jgi:type III restriction enzyme
MSNAFSSEKEEMRVESVLEKRDQELIYFITKELISYYYSDEDGNPYFQKFNKLRRIVQEWYDTKIALLNVRNPEYRKVLYFYEPKTICDHIMRGIYAQQKHRDNILPVFNFYNRFGSTKYVSGNTSRPVYGTVKSHVNYVVADTKAWEQITAKTLEEMDAVTAYVKNAYLGFVIPYVAGGKDKLYYPDFIARCRSTKGNSLNLIIEITGMNQEKAEKKWFVENRWLPAVNAVKDRYGYDEWHFIEISNDIRDIKNQLTDKILGIENCLVR